MIEKLKEMIKVSFPVTDFSLGFMRGLQAALEIAENEKAEEQQNKNLMEEVLLGRKKVLEDITSLHDAEDKGYVVNRTHIVRLYTKLNVYDDLLKGKNGPSK